MKLLPGPDYFRDNVAWRNDTLLGACHAIGEDFGFHPNFLRVPLAAGIIVAPFVMVGIYLALCALVFVSRTFYPDRAKPVNREVSTPLPEAGNETVELPRAA